MESAYSLANKEIEKIRRANKEEQQRRENEVRQRAPEFSQIEAQLAAGGAALARCVLNGNGDISVIRRHIEKAQEEKKRILTRLNLPENYLDEIHNCEKCRDTGFDENGRRCDCLKSMISKYIGVNSNLTDAMKEQTFEKFDYTIFANQPDVKGRSVLEMMKNTVEKAKDFAKDFKQTKANIFIYGHAGTGKTYLSSCIANKALELGNSVYYQSAFSMLDMFEKLKFGRYDEEDAERAEYAAKYVYDVDLLIIDDLGTEFVSTYTTAVLFDILNSRIASGKSTVISSNFNLTKINEIYGARVASRIEGSFDMFAFLGKDLRKRV